MNQYRHFNKRRRDPIERKLVLGLIGGIGRLLSLPFKQFLPKPTINQFEIARQWQAIEALCHGSSVDPRSAILSADNLLDYVLKKISSGSTMGERLKNAQNQFSSWETYQDAWEAHKVRNGIAHEMDHRLTEGEARETIECFRRALRGLGAM